MRVQSLSKYQKRMVMYVDIIKRQPTRHMFIQKWKLRELNRSSPFWIYRPSATAIQPGRVPSQHPERCTNLTTKRILCAHKSGDEWRMVLGPDQILWKYFPKFPIWGYPPLRSVLSYITLSHLATLTQQSAMFTKGVCSSYSHHTIIVWTVSLKKRHLTGLVFAQSKPAF